MSALDSTPLGTLSDRDAVALLFDLTGHGEAAGRDKLVQLDAEVYGRLVQAYDADQPPVLELAA